MDSSFELHMKDAYDDSDKSFSQPHELQEVEEHFSNINVPQTSEF